MQLIDAPSVIKAAGTPAKLIAEYVGRLNTGGSALSIAHMISPQGWREPADARIRRVYGPTARRTVR